MITQVFDSKLGLLGDIRNPNLQGLTAPARARFRVCRRNKFVSKDRGSASNDLTEHDLEGLGGSVAPWLQHYKKSSKWERMVKGSQRMI